MNPGGSWFSCNPARWPLLLLFFLSFLPTAAFAGGGGCTGNGCAKDGVCTVSMATLSSVSQTTIPFKSYLDSYSDMGAVVSLSRTVRVSPWLRVSAEGTMGDLGDVSVTLNPSQGSSIYRMISRSPTGVPFFPADVEAEFFWRFEIKDSPLSAGPLVLHSNKVVYRASNVTSFPPSPGTAFVLASTMTLTSPTEPGINCTVPPGNGRVVYSGQGIVPVVLINEINVDDGGLRRQFLELYDGGTGYTPLDDVSVVLFSGDGDQPYGEVLRLTGRTTDRDGYFVIGDPGVQNVDLVKTTVWHPGPAAVALYVSPGVAFTPPASPSTNQLMEAVVYGPAAQPDEGLLSLVRPGMPQADEGAAGDSTAHSLQRGQNGRWRRDTRSYQANPPTPGLPNQPDADPGPEPWQPPSPTGATADSSIGAASQPGE
jgi:hypothetical protein